MYEINNRRPCHGVAAVDNCRHTAGEREIKMEAKLYVGNLSKSTTQDELNVLFAQAGEVTVTEVIKDRKSGDSRGFAFITMSAQSEADKAVRYV